MGSVAKCALVAAMAGLFLARPAAGQGKTVRLTVGQSENINVRGTITRVQVLNSQIADVASYTTR
jgi:hypothetical protein